MMDSGQNNIDRRAADRELVHIFGELLKADCMTRRPGLARPLAAAVIANCNDPRDLEPMLTGALLMHEALRRQHDVA